MLQGWLTKSILMPLAVVASLLATGSSASAPPPSDVLAVELSVDIDYVDPALAYYVPSWTIEYATCAKLLNYPDRDAPRGGVLQPEVAAGMPLVSPDGRTYSFQIRDDFFFAPSNERVTAANFKHAIDRALNKNMSSPAQPFLDDIVGADAVIRGDTTSTSGVVVDGNTLRITLVAPSADFLARLTMPFACPLPLSVGTAPGGLGAPVPSAGPYYIESWTRGSSIVVKENPFYTGDRPHHFDEIRYGIGLPLETIKLRIDSGDTDLGDIPPAAHGELAPLYGPGSPAALLGRQRWFAFPAPTVLYLAMNHDRPLFGDDPATGPGLDPRGNVALKQAVNYAIDRTTMMAQRGAYAGVPTDQHLPYGMLGFRDVEIYPAHPDVTRARELAGWSPGDPIRNGVLYCANTAPAVAICNIVQANLREIGLEMEIKLFPRATQFELAGRRGEPFDMTLEGWHMDYYDPFDFLFLLDGSTLQPANNVNFAYFNDPVYNARIDAANLLFGQPRADAFGDLDIDIARNAAPWAPYGVPNDRYYFSERVGCQVYVPPYSISLGALCLRPAISIADAEVAEGDSGTQAVTFTVTLSEAAAADYPVGVAFSTSEGTAGGGDFVARSGLVTFGSGEKTKTIAIDVLGDTTHEPDESFTVHLSAATKGTIVDARATGTIKNDDPAPPAPPQPDTQAPADPIVRSTSHVTGRTSRDRTIDVTWAGASDNDSGIDGFSFHWDRQPSSLPDAVKDMEETAMQTTSPALANGSWYFHLRTRDNAGNWTATRHLGPFVIFVPRALRCLVPNVKRKTVPAARIALTRARCSLGRVSRAYSAKVRKGRIISQSRRPGARLARGTKVNLLVSRGKRRR